MDTSRFRPTLIAPPLGVDPLQIVLPPGHPLTARSEIRLDDLADEQWVTGCISCRKHLLTSTSAAGFTPDIRHSTDDYVVVQALVATRMAVAVLPSLALRASRNPDVTVHPLADHAPRRVSAITRRSARSVPSVGARARCNTAGSPGPGKGLISASDPASPYPRKNGPMDAAPRPLTEMPDPQYVMVGEGYRIATYSWGDPRRRDCARGPRVLVELPRQLGEHGVGPRPHSRRIPRSRRGSARTRCERQAARSSRVRDAPRSSTTSQQCSTRT